MRRLLPWYYVVSVVLLLLAFTNEALNVGGAWRWGYFEGYPSVGMALRMIFNERVIAWEGSGLSNHMKLLAGYGCLLMVLGGLMWLASRRPAFAPWKVRLASGLLLLSNVSAITSVLQLDDSLFEWKHGSRYGRYDRYRGLRAFSDSGKFGFKDSNGSVVIPARFSCVGSVFTLSNPPAVVMGVNGKQTLVDYKGEELFPAIYEELSSLILNRDWIRAKYQGKWGFIDFRGRIKLPFKYEGLGEMASGVVDKPLIPYQVGSKWGYIDEIGSPVLDPVWDHASVFLGGVAQVKRGGKECYINEVAFEVVPCQFDSIMPISDDMEGNRRPVPDLFWVTEGEKTGVYDSRLKKVAIPLEYDSRLVMCKIKRTVTGYSLTGIVGGEGPEILVSSADGEKPDIPWARFEPTKKEDPSRAFNDRLIKRLPSEKITRCN